VPTHDYAQPGAYFITIVTADRRCVFGDVADDTVKLSSAGVIAQDELLRTAELRAGIALDAYVVMPNHVHAILWLLDGALQPAEQGTARRAPTEPVHRRFGKPASRSLSTVVGAYKSAVTRRIRSELEKPALAVWQRGYHEHIIRSEKALANICQYVAENPRRWCEDPENPATTRSDTACPSHGSVNNLSEYET
jgi:REP element-mobilizing transposase RayT